MGFWDPGNLDSIPWSDLSYDDDLNFTAKRSYHAAAILVFYADAVREKQPDFCNQVHAGWQAHFKRPISAEDLDRMPTVGDNAYTDEEVAWCTETIRYLRGQLDDKGLIDRGLPVGGSRQTSRRAAAAADSEAAATAATPPPRGRERRVEQRTDETSSDSDLGSSNAKGSGRSRARSQQGRSGGDGPVHKMRYGLHFSAYLWASFCHFFCIWLYMVYYAYNSFYAYLIYLTNLSNIAYMTYLTYSPNLSYFSEFVILCIYVLHI
jgi:hypothetical protein